MGKGKSREGESGRSMDGRWEFGFGLVEFEMMGRQLGT